jgi:hypothetical protein
VRKTRGKAVERALDRVVFGTNDPKAIDKKLDKMEQFLRQEASSLGHALAGIRHRNYWSFEKVAKEAGVAVSVWKGWEADLETPSPHELRAVLERLHWSWDLERFLKLREKGPRLRLRRLTSLQPLMLAAEGVAGVSATYEWRSLGEDLKERLARWAAARELEFPSSLLTVLASLGSDEAREAWIDEVLSERGSGEKPIPGK